MHLLISHQQLHISFTSLCVCYRIFQNTTSFCSILLFWAIFQLSKVLNTILIHYSCSCPKNVIPVLSSSSGPAFFHSLASTLFLFLLFCTSPTFGVDSWNSVERRYCIQCQHSMSVFTRIINHIHFMSYSHFAYQCIMSVGINRGSVVNLL